MIRHWFSDPGCHTGRSPDWRRSLITVCSGESSVRHQHWGSMHVVNDLETTRPKSRSTSMAALRKPTEETKFLMTRKTHFSFAGWVQILASTVIRWMTPFWWFWWLSLVVTQNGFTEFKTSQKFPIATLVGCRYYSLVSILLSRLIEKLK